MFTILGVRKRWGAVRSSITMTSHRMWLNELDKEFRKYHYQILNLKMTKRPASFTASTSDSNCALCKTERHSLFTCPRLKILTHGQKMPAVKSSDLCINRLHPGHFVKQCYSAKMSESSSHTILHIDQSTEAPTPLDPNVSLTANASPTMVPGSILMHDMSCVVTRTWWFLPSPVGLCILYLILCQTFGTAFCRDAKIHGVAGLSHDSHTQLFTTLISYCLSLAGLHQGDQCESCYCAQSDMQPTKSEHSIYRTTWQTSHLQNWTLVD